LVIAQQCHSEEILVKKLTAVIATQVLVQGTQRRVIGSAQNIVVFEQPDYIHEKNLKEEPDVL